MKIFNRIGGAILAALLALAPIVAHAQFADQRTYATAPAGGTANALTIAIPNVVGPPKGVLFKFIPSFANTGPTQANINGTGLKNVLKTSGAGPIALTGGEFQPNQIAGIVYDGTQYQLVFISNAAAASVVMPPQGYLTPCPQANGATLPSGCIANQLLPSADVTVGVGQTVTGLVYTPAVAGGNQAPVWNGSQFVNFTFQELTLTIPSSRLAGLIYDACLFNNAGSLAIGFTPVWSNSSAGSGNRGTGAGSPQIERKNGIWVNSVSVSVVNGGTTTVVPANQCTYVATVMIGGSNGVVTFHRSYGQNRVWPIFNAYNRQTLNLRAGDSTTTWGPNSIVAGEALNQTSANNATVLSGLPEEPVDIRFTQAMQASGAGSVSDAGIMIGINSVTTGVGKRGRNQMGVSGASVAVGSDMVAQYKLPAFLGANVINMNQWVTNNTNARVYYGGENNCLMTADWRG